MSSQDEKDEPAPVNHGPSPPFMTIVSLFQKLSNVSSDGARERRQSLIKSFIATWREEVGNDIYPAFQLIMPQVDSESTRTLYNLKEKKLGKILVKAFNLPEASVEAKALMNYRAAKGQSSGDFTAVAFSVIDDRDSKLSYSNITVDQLLEILSRLSSSNLQEQVKIVKELLSKMNASEMKWVLRIILRHLGIHVSEATVFNCWHPDALALYKVTNDLKLVAHQLWDVDVRLTSKDQEIKPMFCFKPQKAQFKKHLMDKFDALKENFESEFYIEEKIDGERMQLHYTDSGRKTKYFSRNGKDYTDLYGHSVDDENGTLSKYLKGVVNPNFKDFILDGEIAAYDSANKEILPFSRVKQVAVGGNSGHWHPLFLVFDILYLNGDVLTGDSLRSRKQALGYLLRGGDNASPRLRILDYVVASTAEEIKHNFDEAQRKLSEGLVLKHPRKPYVVDGRDNSWIKVKPEYIDGYQGENFDLIVVGGRYGRGYKAGMLASFLCAVRSDDSFEFLTCVKVGGGLALSNLQRIAQLTEHKWKEFNKLDVPSWLKLNLEKDAMDVYINPKDSVVLEVKATQITNSENGLGYSLRFPRFVALREDKDWDSALSYSEFMELQRSETAGEEKKRKTSEASSGPNRQSKKRQIQDSGEPMVSPVLGTSLNGLELFVAGNIEEPELMERPAVEQLIRSYGGEPTRLLGVNSIPIAGANLPRVARFVRDKSRSVVHPSWIFDSIEAGRLIDREPQHYFSADNEMIEFAKQFVDSFGFPLTRPVSPEWAEKLLGKMPEVFSLTSNQREQIIELLLEGGGLADPGFLFYDTLAYLDLSLDKVRAHRLKRLIIFGGGRVTGQASDRDVTAVVCDDEQRKALYEADGQSVVTTKDMFDLWQKTEDLFK